MAGRRTASYLQLVRPRGFLERNLAGERICVWCGSALKGRRLKWCSDECVTTYQFAAGHQEVIRHHIEKRDGGICAVCGVDTLKQRRAYVAALGAMLDPRSRERVRGWFEHSYVPRPHVQALAKAFRIDSHRRRLWDADHIVPVAEGGPNTLENFQTLCQACHKAKTAQQAARKAKRRKRQGELSL